jgi:hypothetical protein
MPREALISEKNFCVVKQWMIVVQTPVQSLEHLVSAIEKNIELVQGNYSHCMYIRSGGKTRFKSEDGAYGGQEANVRIVDSSEIILTIAYDLQLLACALSVIKYHHVHEEPTINITETWGCLSGKDDTRDNPNRYWNRQDAEAIHGEVARN